MTSKLALQWLPCQAPGVIGSVLGLVGQVSVYCDWVRWKVRSATSISVWQHVKLSEQIRPWDTLACCWDVKQPTNKQTHSSNLYSITHVHPLSPCVCGRSYGKRLCTSRTWWRRSCGRWPGLRTRHTSSPCPARAASSGGVDLSCRPRHPGCRVQGLLRRWCLWWCLRQTGGGTDRLTEWLIGWSIHWLID